MAVSQSFCNPPGNKLLAALPAEEYQRLKPVLETVTLPFKQYLYHCNQPIEYVYFPNSGIISVVALLADGGSVEVMMAGNEGMVGISILLGADRIPNETFVQIPGDALRIKADAFRREVVPGSPLHNLLLRYTQALLVQLMQSAACNCRHSVEERCCRWLLMTHDRVESNEFPLTQEFLSQMLGVRRASVSVVAGILQNAGLIRYHRGTISILNRQGLEAASCECYQAVKQECERLLG